MANTFKYAYSQSVANKLKNDNTDYFFRTVVRYELDSNGKPTGKSTSQLYYLPSNEKGSSWNRGDENTGKGFDPTGYVLAAESSDGGATWTPKQYTVADVDKHSNISAGRVGQDVLGADALQSLQKRDGRFWQTAQNSIINTLVTYAPPGTAKAVAAKLNNTATPDPPPPPLPDPPPPPPETEEEKADRLARERGENQSRQVAGVKVAAGQAKARRKYDLFKYPLDLEPAIQDTLQISVYEFVPRKLKGLTITAREEAGTKNRGLIGSVMLPIINAKDSNKVGWGGKPMDAFDIAKSDLAKSIITKGGEGAATALRNIIDQSLDENVRAALESFFAQRAAGVQGLLGRTEGIIVNPNLELLFSGPTLRSFGFSYRMSPRSEDESIMIKKIIRMFKQSMAAQRSSTNIFLKTPNTYRLKYRHKLSDHSFLPKIKECALVGFDVNYTPDGTYATYANSSMVAYELQFTFQELEPLFNDDYGNLEGKPENDTNIGY